MKKGDKYGAHRVIEPKGVLPQAADRIDNTMEIYDNEILVSVKTLNVDSASFTQIEEEAGHDTGKIGRIIMDTVTRRGKQHNPVTGSGGMFMGTIEQVGPALKGTVSIKPGDFIASLVSLSTTPLVIEKIVEIRPDRDQVDIVGKAILFESGIYVKLPEDMPQSVSLAVLDVAGAAAQTAKLVKPGDTVFIIGAGGKSGMLCAYEAQRRAGVTGMVIGTGHSAESTRRIRELGFCDHVIQVNATDPLEVEREVSELTGGRMADVTINCVNIPNTEMGSIVATKNDGLIYFFSMATSFTKAALGAEGIGSDATMIIGNGYTKGHAEISLNILRECSALREIFMKLYA
jgi:L-erythro-3,5-diaminohexanoate dehydrogenase